MKFWILDSHLPLRQFVRLRPSYQFPQLDCHFPGSSLVHLDTVHSHREKIRIKCKEPILLKFCSTSALLVPGKSSHRFFGILLAKIQEHLVIKSLRIASHIWHMRVIRQNHKDCLRITHFLHRILFYIRIFIIPAHSVSNLSVKTLFSHYTAWPA